MDGFTNADPVTDISSSSVLVYPSQNHYGARILGNLQFDYPMTVTNSPASSQKVVVFINGGYAATSVAPIMFSAFTMLWFNQ
jgi:hypothetical protein